MRNAAVGGRLLAPLGHAIVAHHGRDAQPVVAEDATTAGRLGAAMLLLVAPTGNRSFVPAERQRQQFVRIGETLVVIKITRIARLLAHCNGVVDMR